jgi:hypothetical protein
MSFLYIKFLNILDLCREMEITIVTGFSAKRDLDVYAGHLILIRRSSVDL